MTFNGYGNFKRQPMGIITGIDEAARTITVKTSGLGENQQAKLAQDWKQNEANVSRATAIYEIAQGEPDRERAIKLIAGVLGSMPHVKQLTDQEREAVMYQSGADTAEATVRAYEIGVPTQEVEVMRAKMREHTRKLEERLQRELVKATEGGSLNIHPDALAKLQDMVVAGILSGGDVMTIAKRFSGGG